jgi:hypothetical protein
MLGRPATIGIITLFRITSEKDLLKLRLLADLNEIIAKLETQEILDLTGLDKADLSRIRISDYTRFSIDRILGLFNRLGFKANVSIVPLKKVS